jgi:hypothetical protein
MRPIPGYLLCALWLNSCAASDPRLTGRFAVTRDLLPVEAGLVADCTRTAILKRWPGLTQASLRDIRSPSGDWILLGWQEEPDPGWEIRFTRIAPVKTEVEIDAAPEAFGADDLRSRLMDVVSTCAEKPKRR